jgi:hypothetical protein
LAAVANSFAEAVSQYAKKKEEVEREYATAMAELERERTALEQLLVIEDKRYDVLGVKPDQQKTAKLMPLRRSTKFSLLDGRSEAEAPDRSG